ncbi:hypothetical protein G9C98_003307 [Cotesia typhae]|uniref:Uncharacterized protein n=1 Tax=Cotesia typhae TaxID=2053667 RepID=A0A8J5UV93_9HYME|nr:hypothetical protein G9C98_003307 [Cotesia typhae]
MFCVKINILLLAFQFHWIYNSINNDYEVGSDVTDKNQSFNNEVVTLGYFFIFCLRPTKIKMDERIYFESAELVSDLSKFDLLITNNYLNCFFKLSIEIFF